MCVCARARVCVCVRVSVLRFCLPLSCCGCLAFGQTSVHYLNQLRVLLLGRALACHSCATTGEECQLHIALEASQATSDLPLPTSTATASGIVLANG